MLRQKTGSLVCPGCKYLVGVNDAECYNCGRRNPGMWGFAPVLARFGRDLGFSQFVMFGSIGLYLASVLYDMQGVQTSGILTLFSPSVPSLFQFGASGAVPVFVFGRWWTLLSAGWLHGGLLHIFFNMMWVRDLTPATSEAYGPSRMMLIYTFSGITGFLSSSVAGVFLPGFLRGADFTVGASAPLAGLLGALLYYGHRTGSRSFAEQIRNQAIYLLIFGFVIRGIDNWAHIGGFVGGYAAGRFFDPLYPERLDHLVGALVAIALTVGAIGLSFAF